MSRRRASSFFSPHPLRPPPHPPNPPDVSKPVCSSSSSSMAQTAPGSSSDFEPMDSDDEPDPDADSMDFTLLSDELFSCRSKVCFPVKLSSSSRESCIGYVPFSVHPRRSLLLFGTNVCGVHCKLNKGPAFGVSDCYCAIHSPPRCSPLWPSRILRSQQLASIPPPLTMPSCASRCCRRGCFPGIEDRRSFTIECVHWSSLASSFDCLLGLEARRPCNRLPPQWSESFRHSLAMCFLKSVAVVAVAFCSIRLPLRFEESLKPGFRSIKSEAFSAETVWIFIILSIMFYVFALFMHLVMHLFVSEESRTSELWMSRFVTVR